MKCIVSGLLFLVIFSSAAELDKRSSKETNQVARVIRTLEGIARSDIEALRAVGLPVDRDLETAQKTLAAMKTKGTDSKEIKELQRSVDGLKCKPIHPRDQKTRTTLKNVSKILVRTLKAFMEAVGNNERSAAVGIKRNAPSLQETTQQALRQLKTANRANRQSVLGSFMNSVNTCLQTILEIVKEVHGDGGPDPPLPTDPENFFI